MAIITKTATVTVKLSMNYCSFEVSQTVESDSDSGLTLVEIDEARKDAHRLAKKAVEQFATHQERLKEQDYSYDFNDDKLLFPNARKSK